jgi:hypothetical protein
MEESTAQWITLVSGVLFSTIGIVLAVAAGFGRRQRLKLAVEVKDAIADEQRTAWDLMLYRDTAAILRASTRPIPLLPLFPILWLMWGMTFIPTLPDVLRTALVICGWALLVFILVMTVVYAVLGRVRNRELDKLIASITAERDRYKAETERLNELSAVMKRKTTEAQLAQNQITVQTLYFSGAPLGEIRRAEDGAIDQLAALQSGNVRQRRRSWRLRRRWRLRFPARDRFGTFAELVQTHQDHMQDLADNVARPRDEDRASRDVI